jgi:di/tricarboxylate transporter
VFVANFVAHALAALAAYLLFGGLALLKARRADRPDWRVAIAPLETRHRLTMAVLAAWIAGVMFLGLSPGPAALAAAAVLILGGVVEDRAAMASIPWTVIVMVCGVSVLVGVLERTGGMDLFTTLLSRLTAPGLANGMMAFVTGLISTYSSTSGVVYPAFLPTVPGLVEKLGGGDPLQLALSINVGAALVDVSPLSTIGALCVAALPAKEDAAQLFRRLLAWGFAMVVAGAVFCQALIRFFA